MERQLSGNEVGALRLTGFKNKGVVGERLSGLQPLRTCLASFRALSMASDPT